MKKIERMKTGVPGLDKLAEGGLVKGSVSLVSGTMGTGKTIFCCQFLKHGLENGENCLFITFEESVKDIINDAASFGWNLEKYVKDGSLIFEYIDPLEAKSRIGSIEELVRTAAKERKIKRIVIDSISILGLYLADHYEFRKDLHNLINALKETGVTTVMTVEAVNGSTRFSVEEFVADAVINLYGLKIGEGNFRSLQIMKMRRTKHAEDVFPFEFGNNGIVVKSKESVFKT
ncbi:MAG: ATPase domain-containing protein [Candidatus Aenigmatarchaeota archaeon]